LTVPIQARLEAVWLALRDEADLGVPQEAFIQRVEAVIAEQGGGRPPDEVIDALVLGDLYLVLGCLKGVDRAIRLFLARFGTYLHRLCHQQAPSQAIGDDVEAQLLATLFTPRHVDDPTSARLFHYRGMGTLQGWLRVTCRRLVIDLIRRQRGEAGDGQLETLPTPGPGLDARVEKAQATHLLAPLFVACVGELSADERTLLRRYYRDGHVLREIGDDLGIDTSSVFRRLGSAREKIWKRFMRRARLELGLSEDDLRALLGSLAAGLDLDVLFAMALVFAGW
jgi:RNA polymerase sigma-70 factor